MKHIFCSTYNSFIYYSTIHYQYKKQKKIGKDNQREKIWKQMDQLEEQLCVRSQDEKQKKVAPMKKSTYKKPDKEKKINQIQAYENALREHRQSCCKFYNPFSRSIVLNIYETEKIIHLLKQARDLQKDVPLALRSLGLKRVKILFKCGAVEHFESVIQYLADRKLPEWMKMKHEQLLRKKF